MVSAVIRELYRRGLELRAWKVHDVWVNLLRHVEKNRQIAQTWCAFQANRSDMARKSGSMKGRTRTRFKLCLKSAKNLYFGYRFFDEIRQIHRIFNAFRQKLPILWGNQARSKSGADRTNGEKLMCQNYNKAPLRSCWDASAYHSTLLAYNRKVDICPFDSVNGNRSPISVVPHRSEVWLTVC